MKQNVTELVFILDRSGSMSGLESDTIGGFNAMLAEQKENAGECYISTILFDNESTVLHDRIKINDVPLMTDKDYKVRGCTALLDTIGDTIKHIKNIHKYTCAEDVPKHTMFVITTDGMENASRKYTSDEIKKLIETQKEECGWEFLFIGANIDAVETAKSYGISEDKAVEYRADERGTRTVYSAVSKAVDCVRCSMTISSEWKEEISKDYNTRKK